MIKVFLCDDHQLVRQGLKKLLELENDIKVAGEAGSGAEALKVLKKVDPDIVLMDIGMPEMDGITTTYMIKKILPQVKIIVLTVHEDEPHIFGAIKAGAMGYLLKGVSSDEVVDAIRRVNRGEALLQPAVAPKVLKEFAMLDKRKISKGDSFFSDLTEREKGILRLIALGASNKDIANRLNIAEKTVRNHLSNIFLKLHVNNRTQAALYATGKRDIKDLV
jgi:DNA-binding NarL/FixJ family response regulator